MSKDSLYPDILSRPINRREALKILTAAAAAGMMDLSMPGTGWTAPDRLTERPNILFILGDNHNAGTMGCAGHPFIKTPGMDRLAREGVLFDYTFNTTSLCSPSRASILTGAYAHRHGVKNNHTPWTGRMITFLEILSRNGYDTAFIGKWHMPGKGLPLMPFLNLYVSYTYREGQGAYFNCPMIVNGREVPSRKPYITEEVTDYAVEFMRTNLGRPRAQRKPFCIYLSHRPGHPPYQAPQGIAGMYDRADVREVLPGNVDPWWYGKTKGNVFQGVMMGSYYNKYRKYCETLTAMDRDIVRLPLDRTSPLAHTGPRGPEEADGPEHRHGTHFAGHGRGTDPRSHGRRKPDSRPEEPGDQGTGGLFAGVLAVFSGKYPLVHGRSYEPVQIHRIRTGPEPLAL